MLILMLALNCFILEKDIDPAVYCSGVYVRPECLLIVLRHEDVLSSEGIAPLFLTSALEVCE
jgi:hypothetical protein